jgi:hypothetical protein
MKNVESISIIKKIMFAPNQNRDIKSYKTGPKMLKKVF